MLQQLSGVLGCINPASGAFQRDCRLPVLRLTQPSSLNSYNPARKRLRTCCCFLLLLILLLCLFWHKTPFLFFFPA